MEAMLACNLPCETYQAQVWDWDSLLILMVDVPTQVMALLNSFTWNVHDSLAFKLSRSEATFQKTKKSLM